MSIAHARHTKTPAYLASEGHHVMLTEGKDFNVLDNHHLVVILLKQRVIDDFCASVRN